MKTTLVLDDALVEQVRQRARERGVSMSSIVEEAIFRMLTEEPSTSELPPLLDLPSYRMGNWLVDITDRNAIYDTMDDPSENPLYRHNR
jgi:hypothetical protein